MTVSPGRQCSLTGCEREAVDPSHPGPLCRSHLDEAEDGRPVTKPEESGCGTDCQESEMGEWAGADFTAPESGVWPQELLEREQWMGHVDKKPFAPWGDRDHPEADEGEDARWKWGTEDNYVDGETVAMAEVDPRLNGRAFLQRTEAMVFLGSR